MKFIYVLAYAVALLLTFSPAFSYVLLTKFASSSSSFMTGVYSLVPLFIGIAMLAILRLKKI